MKKTSVLMIALLAGLCLPVAEKKKRPLPPTAAAPAPAAVVAVVVGLDDHFPPMGFRDEKNNLVGFDIDPSSEAGKRLGVEVKFKPIDWSAKGSRAQWKAR